MKKLYERSDLIVRMRDEVKKVKSIPKDHVAFATGALENPTENVNISFPSAVEFVTK